MHLSSDGPFRHAPRLVSHLESEPSEGFTTNPAGAHMLSLTNSPPSPCFWTDTCTRPALSSVTPLPVGVRFQWNAPLKPFGAWKWSSSATYGRRHRAQVLLRRLQERTLKILTATTAPLFGLPARALKCLFQPTTDGKTLLSVCPCHEFRPGTAVTVGSRTSRVPFI